MNKCPRCGNETEGSYSESGLLWAICEMCMLQNKEKIKIEKGKYCFCGRRIYNIDDDICETCIENEENDSEPVFSINF